MTTQSKNQLFPLLVTENFDAMRAFYVDALGATATFDLDDYLQVRFDKDDEGGSQLCFGRVTTEGPMAGIPVFPGHGMTMSLPADDVKAHHARLEAMDGVDVLNAPTPKPWGWLSYQVKDPSGLVLDFFEVIDAEAAQPSS